MDYTIRNAPSAGGHIIICLTPDEVRAALLAGGEVLEVKEQWRRRPNGRRYPFLLSARVRMPAGERAEGVQ